MVWTPRDKYYLCYATMKRVLLVLKDYHLVINKRSASVRHEKHRFGEQIYI